MNIIYRAEFADMLLVAVPLLAADLETGEILFATPAFERMFDCQLHGGLVGKNVDELVPDAFRSQHTQHREAYKKSPRPLSTTSTMTMGGGRRLRGRKMDGTEFELQIGLIPAVIPSSKQRIVIATAISL